jgi:hypothetical protein
VELPAVALLYAGCVIPLAGSQRLQRGDRLSAAERFIEKKELSVSRVILQINYKFSSTRAEYDALVTPLAEPIASVPGLHWKIWLMNEANNEAGGIYLFENLEAAQAFATSQTVADFLANPTIREPSAKFFEPVENLSRITRGPVAPVAAVT